jgi:tetratricopeptide (TPR) repeat protein
MKRPQLISAGSLNRMLETAAKSWESYDFQQCFEIMERASRLDPANPGIMLQLGRYYGLRYDYGAATQCFDKAIRVASNKTEVLTTAGRLSADFSKPEIAQGYFQRALEQKDATAEIFARLAELYERLHRIEEAYGLINQALQLNRNCTLALLTLARLERRKGRLEESEKNLHAFLTRADRHIQIRGYYELGANLDLQGRYDEAMSAFLEAKKLLLPDAPPLLAQLELIKKYLKQMQGDLSSETLQRWFNRTPALTPSHRLAFLGGHPRSGTTLLEQILDSHIGIVSAEETTIFHDDAYMPMRRNLPHETPMIAGLDAAQTETMEISRKNYFRSMELFIGTPIGNRLLIDKNPSIHVLIPAFVRIFPETKLLIALRDPRDVCMSSFMQAHLPISTASVASLNLEGTVETYMRVMGIWRTLAPVLKNPCLEVRYEDMVDDLESVARRTLDFLGVSWDSRVLRFNEHARQKMVRSPTYADVAKPVHKGAIGRWRNYQKYLEPHLDKLAPLLKAFRYD